MSEKNRPCVYHSDTVSAKAFTHVLEILCASLEEAECHAS